MNYFCYVFFIVLLTPQKSLCKGELNTLNEETWSKMLEGEWMVEFFAPWCPACQQLTPLWKEFAQWSDDLSIEVANVDVTLNPGLSGRFMITALPTIYHVKDGVFRQYKGARDKESFFSFVEEKKWQTIEPVSSWTAPQSYQMSLVSSFFKLSMFLRSMHNTMIQDYGIPYWGSYLIFGLLTILIGALLGLLIVFFIDLVCPAKTTYQPIPQTNNAGKKNEIADDYEGEDVIREDNIDEAEIRRRRDVPTEN